MSLIEAIAALDLAAVGRAPKLVDLCDGWGWMGLEDKRIQTAREAAGEYLSDIRNESGNAIQTACGAIVSRMDALATGVVDYDAFYHPHVKDQAWALDRRSLSALRGIDRSRGPHRGRPRGRPRRAVASDLCGGCA